MRAGAADSLLLSRSAKPAPQAGEQILFKASRKEETEDSQTLFGKADRPRRRSSELDRNRILWLKDRGLVSKPTSPNSFRSQVVSAEEKVVHRALSDIIPESVRVSGVQIVMNSSQVKAQIAADANLDEATLTKLRREFHRLTGRQLVLETTKIESQERASNTVHGVAAPQQQTPARAASKKAAPPQAEVRVEPEDRPPARKVSAPAAKTTPESESSTEPHAKPSLKPISYAVAGPESAAAAAAASAHSAAILALNPEIVIDPKIGIVQGLHQIENRYIAPPSAGGSSRTQRYQPMYSPETEEEEGGETPKRGKKGESPSEVSKERPVHAERTELEEIRDDQRDKGHRGGRSSCGVCGTELPAAQQHACPVCAQSGPDVIALTSVNYRFAGSKFLAAADSVSASAGAQDLLARGLVESVATLRYKQKIPGHKDFLRFRAT